MKTQFILYAAFALFAAHSFASSSEDSGEAQECKQRRDTCGSLCDEPGDSGEDSGSWESSPAPSAAPSTAPSGAPSAAPSVATSFAPSSPSTPGQCICQGSGSGNSGESSGSGSGNSGEGSGSGDSGEEGSGSGNFHSHCELIEAFYNISITLTIEQQTIFIAWIQYIENTISVDITITSEEKFVLIAYELKTFLSIHYDIAISIGYQWIGSWGYVVNIIDVAVDIKTETCGLVVALDGEDNCPLFDALLNFTSGNAEQTTDVEILITQIKTILLDVSISYEQQLAAIYVKFQSFFSAHVEWEAEFLSGCSIEGFGSLEIFIDVTLLYQRITTLEVVLGGSGSDCVIIQALLDASTNSSFQSSTKNALKQLATVLQNYFSIQVNIEFRLKFFTAQVYQLFKLEDQSSMYLVSFFERITLVQWGTFHDLYFCGGWWGEHHHDETTIAASTTVEATTAETTTVTTTTVTPTTTKPTSTTTKPTTTVTTTTAKPTTTTAKPTTTVAPTTTTVNKCSTRQPLITIDSSNATIFTTSINAAYNNWDRTFKGNFLTYKKRVETYIWSTTEFITWQSKVNNIIVTLNSWTNNQSYKDVVFAIQLTGWGTVGEFCGCGNATST